MAQLLATTLVLMPAITLGIVQRPTSSSKRQELCVFHLDLASVVGLDMVLDTLALSRELLAARRSAQTAC